MKSIDFPGATLKIGKDQEDTYNVIHAMPVPGPHGEIIACFELDANEIEMINQSRKIFYSRWTFAQTCNKCGTKQGFAPMRIFVLDDNGVPVAPPVPKLDIETLKDIDLTTKEGAYLWAALITLTTEHETDKTPDEVLKKLKEALKTITKQQARR